MLKRQSCQTQPEVAEKSQFAQTTQSHKNRKAKGLSYSYILNVSSELIDQIINLLFGLPVWKLKHTVPCASAEAMAARAASVKQPDQ